MLIDKETVYQTLHRWTDTISPASAVQKPTFLFTEDTATPADSFWRDRKEEVEEASFFLASWVVPGSHLRGKKGRLQRRAGAWVNVWLEFCGLGDGGWWSTAVWQQQCRQHRLPITHQTIIPHRFQFTPPLIDLPPHQFARARGMLAQAPNPVVEYLTPQLEGDRIAFQLKIIFICCGSS